MPVQCHGPRIADGRHKDKGHLGTVSAIELVDQQDRECRQN
jgi:hypothetical protein